jgi:hypothetical protein
MLDSHHQLIKQFYLYLIVNDLCIIIDKNISLD